MTLGGLALAVGILVDDATVTIENINCHLEQGKEVEAAILDGAQQIALPALVSTLSICIVFVPMFLLAGIAKFLFMPLAEAVVFAMLASYLLSRTLVPTLAKFWLKRTIARAHKRPAPACALSAALRARLRDDARGLPRLLERALHSGPRFAADLSRLPWRPRRCSPFPSGRCPGSARTSSRAWTAARSSCTCARAPAPASRRPRRCAMQSRRRSASVIPAAELANIVDNIGLPYSGINLAYSTSAPVGPGDADIFVNLRRGIDRPPTTCARCARQLPRPIRRRTFAFLPADMVSQILNFGLPSPLDVQVVGFNVEANRDYANHLLQKLRAVPGAVDLHIQQAVDYPQFNVDVDRSKAQLLGLTEQAVATNMLVSLSGSFQTSPSFWIDPKTGTQYQVAAQTPQYRAGDLNDLGNTPLNGPRRHRAAPLEPGRHSPQRRARGGEPLQRNAGHRHLRLGARHAISATSPRRSTASSSIEERSAARLERGQCAARCRP